MILLSFCPVEVAINTRYRRSGRIFHARALFKFKNYENSNCPPTLSAKLHSLICSTSTLMNANMPCTIWLNTNGLGQVQISVRVCATAIAVRYGTASTHSNTALQTYIIKLQYDTQLSYYGGYLLLLLFHFFRATKYHVWNGIFG